MNDRSTLDAESQTGVAAVAEAPAPTLAEGTELNGRYVVAQMLGTGGMGSVYQARDKTQDRLVALKLVRGQVRVAAKQSMLKAEFRTMARLDHPNVARVYDFEALAGSGDFVLTMELVAGAPIDRVCAVGDWEPVVGFAVQLCRALSYIHSRRIIHMDIKPSNIVIAGQAKLVDFGLASTGVFSGEHLTGTPQYMAPELLSRQDAIDHRVDLFSLGVSLFELLTGEVPCASRNVLELRAFHHAGGVRFPAGSAVPAWLQRLVEMLCAARPEDRPQSADLVIDLINAGGDLAYEKETWETRLSYVLSAPFLGRQEELQTLTRSLTARSGIIVVGGEAGIGKSRLMREVRQHAQLQRMPFFEADCHEMRVTGFEPLADLLYQLVPFAEQHCAPDVLARALPDLAQVAPRLGAPGAFSADALASVATFCIAVAAAAPYALYVNDLQWASPEVVGVLERLAAHTSIALFGSYRSDEHALGNLLELLGSPSCEMLALGPLREREVRDLVRGMLGENDLPEQFIQRLLVETAGNAFFIQELMRALVESEGVLMHAGRWQLQGAMADIEVPPTVTMVFRRRFRLLDPTHQQLLRSICAHGLPIAWSTLAVLRNDDEALVDDMHALTARNLLQRSDADGVMRVDITHQLMRATVMEDVTAEDRRALHAQLASAIERSPERDVDGLARHYLAAGDTANALPHVLAAGGAAMARSANAAALAYYAQALQLLAPDDARRVAVETSRADVLARSGQRMRAAEIYRALGLWRPLAHVLEQHGDVRGAEAAALQAGDYSVLARCYWYRDPRKALRFAMRAGDAGMAAVLAHRSHAPRFARRLLAEATRAARGETALAILASRRAAMGLPAQLADAVAVLRKSGDLFELGEAALHLAQESLHAGAIEQGVAVLNDFHTRTQASTPQSLKYTLCLHAELNARLGDVGFGLALCEMALAQARADEDQTAVDHALATMERLSDKRTTS